MAYTVNVNGSNEDKGWNEAQNRNKETGLTSGCKYHFHVTFFENLEDVSEQ